MLADEWRFSWCSVVPACAGLSGCAAAAPSFSLFGAFFPIWLGCLLFGVVVAIATRIGVGASRLSTAGRMVSTKLTDRHAPQTQC